MRKPVNNKSGMLAELERIDEGFAKLSGFSFGKTPVALRPYRLVPPTTEAIRRLKSRRALIVRMQRVTQQDRDAS